MRTSSLLFYQEVDCPHNFFLNPKAKPKIRNGMKSFHELWPSLRGLGDRIHNLPSRLHQPSEVGDVNRFSSLRELMGWGRLAPSAH